MSVIWNYLKSLNWMLWSLLLGASAGLVFGERMAFLQTLGHGFIKLMQISIIPYIIVSLVSGLARFSQEQVKQVLGKAALIILTLWTLGIFSIWAFSFTLPKINAGTFFSPALISPPVSIDFIGQYIPANPFAAMAQGNIPALVIFCIILGMSLISNKSKYVLLDVLDVIGQGLNTISKKIIALFPIGIFAMSASSAGTISETELANLQIYWVLVIFLGLYLMVFLLPMLAAAVTPIKYRDLLSVMRDAWIVAFSTGNIFIVLPIITEGIKAHMRKINQSDETSDHIAEVLVPIAYTFPSLGKLTTLIFVTFSAWLTGNPIEIEQIPSLTLSAMLSYFASVHIAIPYLLDVVKVPAESYQLYLSMAVLSAKMTSPTAVVYIFTCVFMTIFFVRKQLQFKRLRTLYYLVTPAVVLPVLMVICLSINSLLVKEATAANDVIGNLTIADRVPEDVRNHVPTAYQTGELAFSTIELIQKRGVLRVGYLPDNVPFSYFNQKGELVGFDISLAHTLAADLGVRVEFIPFKKPDLALYLNKGYFDIAMSGLEINVKELTRVRFSNQVMTLQLALVAKDHELKRFESKAKLLEAPALKLAHVEYGALLGKIKGNHPNFNTTSLESVKAYFNQPEHYDALVLSAEAGFAWSMFYPEFGVVVPKGIDLKYPIGFAVARYNLDMLSYLNAWLDIQKANGTITNNYNYWILGKNNQPEAKRWALIDNW